MVNDIGNNQEKEIENIFTAKDMALTISQIWTKQNQHLNIIKD